MENGKHLRGLPLILGALFVVLSACSVPGLSHETIPAGATTSAPCAPVTPDFIGSRTLDFEQADGSTRIAQVHIPAQLDPKEPVPVVLAFHGYGGRSAQVVEMMKLDELAKESGVVVVAPQGQISEFDKAGWGLMPEHFASDALFVDQVLTEVNDLVCVDRHRVFAMGYSNGSVFAQKYACRKESSIVAVASVAGTVIAKECPGGPIPLIYFHGTADEVVPFEGAETKIGWLDGVEESLLAWARLNGCDGGEQTDSFESQVVRQQWDNCPEGAEVRSYVTIDGGHRWPGGLHEEWNPAHGTVETTLDATTRSWRFFERAAQASEQAERPSR